MQTIDEQRKTLGLGPLPMRHFASGATRDNDSRKLDFDAIFDPRVLEAFAHYMNICRETPEGLREADNWKHGFPMDVLMKSMWRHFFALWKSHHEFNGDHPLVAACALLFNVQAYMKQLIEADSSLVNSMLVAITLEHAERSNITQQREIADNGS